LHTSRREHARHDRDIHMQAKKKYFHLQMDSNLIILKNKIYQQCFAVLFNSMHTFDGSPF
jgi:hypothetical protein